MYFIQEEETPIYSVYYNWEEKENYPTIIKPIKDENQITKLILVIIMYINISLKVQF